MRKCNLTTGLLALKDDYDAFIIDQWGVLHDGCTPYSNAVYSLQVLKNMGKKIIVLSNSGKQAGFNSKLLAAIGFEPKLFAAVISSGEAFLRKIKSGKLPFTKKKAFYIAAQESHHDWSSLGLEFTKNIAQASWVFLSGVAPGVDFEYYRQILLTAAKLELPLVCANPDLLIVTPERRTFKGPGQLAVAYQKLGGKVYFFGKPHPYIYEFCAAELTRVAKKRTLCVGDSLEHDIKGANLNGYDSLLIGGGIFFEQFSQLKDPQPLIKKLSADFKAFPDWYSFEI